MKNFIPKNIKGLLFRPIDPVKDCHYYKKFGCAHVDGFLCNVFTCSTNKEYVDSLERSEKLKKIISKLNEKKV